jgi:23S rRNA A1618 N6-methylase RlmF
LLNEQFKCSVKIKQNGAGIIDFRDPDAVRALTTALLRHDFALLVHIPKDTLCPAVFFFS